MDRAAIRSLLEGAYAARVKRDLDGAMAAFHPGCDYQLMAAGEMAEMGTQCCGGDAVRDKIAALIETFDFADFEITDLIIDGDKAALRWRAQVTARKTGRRDLFEVLDLFTFEDGRIKSMQQFTDTANVARLVS